MTLLDLMTFYRRAAEAKHAYNQLCARLTAIDLILMRLADVGRQEPTDGPWNTAKMRVVQIGLVRRHAFEQARGVAYAKAHFDEREEKEVEKTLEGVRMYARERKRGMS